jgi:DNA phosphorothioation-dependent restriction protein DptG
VVDVQKKFKADFYFMLETGMTSLEDFSNILAIYYFYYMSQACVALDQFCQGRRDVPVKLYYALDWEKVSKNRKCCVEGWERIQTNVNHMFSHALTLEILNQHTIPGLMLDYIAFQEYVIQHPEQDDIIAKEIEKAEQAYTSCVGDYKKFNQIKFISGDSKTDAAIQHLYRCVEEQFLNTDRKRANQFYNEKFIDFCKARWIKNRRKSGLVLNLTERDIIFLTKISIKNQDKIRLIDLYKEYEYRGIFLDNTSKEYLQEFFTKLNLIDKKSDSGDAQYVKRIL